MPPKRQKRRREGDGGGGEDRGGGGESSTPPPLASPAPALNLLARIEQNLIPTYKLSFVNSLSGQIFTKRPIRAADGALIKITITSGASNKQFSSSHLLSSRMKIVVLDGDFNVDNHEGWTSEEFCNHIVRPRDKVGVVLTGDLELKLKNGEAYLENATFIDNSRFTRSGKFRLGVRLIDDLGERVQEGITEPFVVKDRRGEEYQKSKIPLLDDELWRLQKISKGGVFHGALKRSGIHTVKQFLRLYYKDEKALRNILRNVSELVWKTIVNHAKKCDPGRALYSHFIEDKDIRLYFSSVGQIVGATIDNQYNAFDDVYLTQNKALLDQWTKDAYECMNYHQPDYEVYNSEPRPIDYSTFQGLITPGSTSTEPTDKIIPETDQQDSSKDNNFSGNLSQQCPLPSAHENNDLTDESYDETIGSIAPNQGAVTMEQGSYQMPFGNDDSSLFRGQEQGADSHCASPISQSIQSEPPHISMEDIFRDIDMHIWDNWEQNQLGQNIDDPDNIPLFFSAPNVTMMPADVGCSMTKLASCRGWIKLATLLKSMAMLRACRNKARP
ncbi:Calmodulin-binding protein 60 C [Dichanthelium oligosanthes]|uniref:Calmodulin-binding protein 60 C n=1 Tax=Dichanthelium oligosanthes TaxID=888268 RepID=A0A1E5W9T4_9POAL|nr:Calmodulin-binding protein 60 C [Dichanthelium oligosanthes]